MPATAEGLQIPVGFSLEEAQLALRSLEEQARAAGRRIRDGVEPGVAALEAGGRAHQSLGTSIRDFARGQRQEAAAARFYVNELASIAPVSESAKTALMGLTSALVGGLGVGTAIGLVTTAAQLYVQWLNRQEEAQKKATEAAREHARALGDVESATRRYLMQAQGFRDEQIDAAEKIGPLDEKLKGLRDRYANLGAQIEELRTVETGWRVEQEKFPLSAAQARAAYARDTAAELAKERATLLAEIEKLQQMRDALGRQFGARVNVAEVGATREARATTQASDPEKARREEFERLRAHNLAKLDLERSFIDLEYDVQDAGDARRLAAERASHEQELFELKLASDEWLREYERREQAIRQFTDLGKNAMQGFGASVGTEFGRLINRSAAYERAMRAAGKATNDSADLSAAAFAAFAQNAVASVAQESATRAVFEVAMGLAALARTYWDPSAGKEAGLHFAAAAEFGAVAAVAGAVAYGIGQSRGMTRAERASVDEARRDQAQQAAPASPLAEGSTSGSRGGPNITVIFSGRALVTEQEVKRYLSDLMADTRQSGW